MTDIINDPQSGDIVQPPSAKRPAERKRGRNRVRTALALILALLVLLLAVLTMFVVRLSHPIGAPSKGDLTEGMQWVRSIYGWGKGENQQLYGPTDVGVGSNGTIWVNDPQRFQLIAFNPDGSYRTIIHKGPWYMMPQAFEVASNNEIYVADFANNKIRVFKPDNTEVRSWDTSLPIEVAVKGDRVVVGGRDRVSVFDTKGKLILQFGSRGKAPEQVDVVRGVAIGPDGSIYFSDTENHRIKSYSAAGKLKWVYPTEADFARYAAASKLGKKSGKPFQIPAGMTFDNAGRLVLVDPFEFAIMAVDPKNGHVLKRYGDFGATDGKFAYPTSIDYDPVRDWFVVADTANNRVQVVRLTGSGGSPLSGIARAAVGPVWICAIPLILLLLALVIAVMRRRQRRGSAPDADNSTAVESQGEAEL